MTDEHGPRVRTGIEIEDPFDVYTKNEEILGLLRTVRNFLRDGLNAQSIYEHLDPKYHDFFLLQVKGLAIAL